MSLITVNGEQHDLPSLASVQDVVAALGIPAKGRGVAVAVDGEVVPRGEWAATRLRAGARVEVVTAVQGG